MEIISISILSVMFANWFQPIQWVKNKIIFSKLGDYIPTVIKESLYCPKCCGLWIGLILTNSLKLAVIISFTSYIISNIINKIDNGKNS